MVCIDLRNIPFARDRQDLRFAAIYRSLLARDNSFRLPSCSSRPRKSKSDATLAETAPIDRSDRFPCSRSAAAGRPPSACLRKSLGLPGKGGGKGACSRKAGGRPSEGGETGLFAARHRPSARQKRRIPRILVKQKATCLWKRDIAVPTRTGRRNATLAKAGRRAGRGGGEEERRCGDDDLSCALSRFGGSGSDDLSPARIGSLIPALVTSLGALSDARAR
jgi:hypothetical protein